MDLLKLSDGLALSLEPGQRYWLVTGQEQQLQTRFDECASALHKLKPGSAAALESSGGLLSNLRVWENLVLPAWYHQQPPLADLEQRFVAAFARLGIDGEQLEKTASALPASLDREHKRQLALVRAMVQQPAFLLTDQDWYGWIVRSAPGVYRELFDELADVAPVIVLGVGSPDLARGLVEVLPNVANEPAG
ncbi:hypothetical protein [Silvimonas soli]|uniref:hypothetical protein n=1 Tax=Silvimonas soli TaxID=2980100 RepID=UPI0024B37ED6|nr:hypothetical protein [Silvimonas soli]